MATKKLPVVHVAVVGLTSSSFPGTSGQGAGKSVLCNRFVRPKRDDLCLNHSSIMTNSDFGSSMVNNDHHLYWGEKIAALEDGSVSFQIVEHTEFVEDGNLQLYSIVKPYHKRCIQQKLVSGGKMQYIHPDQLAVPDEFSNVARFPDKFTVDGYIICIDVSDDELPEAQGTQREFLGRLLPAIMGVKKAHIVVALTKFDIAKEKSIAAANEILSKCRRQPTVIEVSALEGVNIDVCFLVLAHLVDSRRPRTRILAFSVAHANLKERVRRNEESFQGLLSGRITDFSLPLPVARKSLENEVEFQLLRELKGIDRVDRLIRAQLKYLKEGVIKSKTTDFLDHIRASLELFLVNLSLEDTSETCVELIRKHEKFSAYFTENAEWRDDAQFLKQEQTTQVPFSLLGREGGTEVAPGENRCGSGSTEETGCLRQDILCTPDCLKPHTRVENGRCVEGARGGRPAAAHLSYKGPPYLPGKNGTGRAGVCGRHHRAPVGASSSLHPLRGGGSGNRPRTTEG
ncbi:Rho GTPase-activating protein 190 [Geodia barretti]|uniref:Rho GTPase-activating protein 190 n=1 Tax=Geodia barretti TaxID=519541 RepID=A0AA35SC58_GEOBA|nr:Rho GTPase-activating protein 190 [Geodia barretti]